jgi:hypothetical protein
MITMHAQLIHVLQELVVFIHQSPVMIITLVLLINVLMDNANTFSLVMTKILAPTRNVIMVNVSLNKNHAMTTTNALLIHVMHQLDV